MASTMSPEQAAQLVRRVLAGEREAYAGIVTEYQGRVRAALAGYCRSAEEVEELCQLAFIEAYEQRLGLRRRRAHVRYAPPRHGSHAPDGR